MSGFIHKIEEEIKHKIDETFHRHHKEDDKVNAEQHRPDESDKHKAGHGEQLKDLMHKIKKKIGEGNHDKKKKKKSGGGGHGEKRHGEEHHEEGEEYEEEESESESESEYEEEGGDGGGEFEFDL